MEQGELLKIQRLVGQITTEQLRYVDCFVGRNVGIFMPVGGACFYAITPEHRHPAYMFVHVFDHHSNFMMQGREIPVQPGKIFALSPDIPHHELPSDQPPRYLAVMIDRDFFDGQLALYPDAPKIALNGQFLDSPREFVPACKRFILESQSESPGKDALLEAIGVEIAHLLIRCILQIRTGTGRDSSRFEINQVVEYLHSNLTKRITIQDMARVACMSVSHFSRVFKEETGTGPYDYLLTARLALAKKQLFAGDKTITDIALECGFSSASHFSTQFSKKYKLSPSQYRNKV